MTYEPCRIVDREGWEALPARPGTPRPQSVIIGLDVHHTTGDFDLDDNPTGIVRSIQRYHMAPHGTEPAHVDIDYNALVWHDGSLFIGRDSAIRGAHNAAQDHNWNRLGIAIIGNGDRPEYVTDAAWSTVLWYWQAVASYSGRAMLLGTHGESYPTHCAGTEVTRRMTDLRRFLSSQVDQGGD